MVIVYGIPNCDTVKKARAWLQAHQVAYAFHDFKKSGVPADRLPAWDRAVGWQQLLNRQGTTWRKLEPAMQASAATAEGAFALMCAQPSVIKRPVLEWGQQVSVGFEPARWDELRAAARS